MYAKNYKSILIAFAAGLLVGAGACVSIFIFGLGSAGSGNRISPDLYQQAVGDVERLTAENDAFRTRSERLERYLRDAGLIIEQLAAENTTAGTSAARAAQLSKKD
jgi:hypothetical protein